MCRKLIALTALVFAFVLIAPLTASADVPVQDGLPQLEMEEPILTPADQPLDLGEMSIEEMLREEKIRFCNDLEARSCPYDCDSCVVINQQIYCFC